jgi:type VI secretion system secreted protein VgrG
MQVKLRIAIGDHLTLHNSEVEHLEVRTALGDHTTMRLQFTRDASQPLPLEDLLGEEATVFLQPNDVRPSDDDGDGDGELPPEIEVFRGKVSTGRQAHHSFRGSEITLEAHSDSWKLEYEDIRHFKEQTAKDVLGTLGFKVSGGGKRTGELLSFLQYKETQFAFAKRIADEFGLFLRTDRGQLVATSHFDQTHALYWGDTLLSIETAAAPRNHGVKGFLYQSDKKQGHLFHGMRKATNRLSGAGTLSSKTDKLLPQDRGGGDSTFIDVPHRARDAAGYKDVLERESVRRAANSVRVIGESIECRLSAGDLVDIQNIVGYRTPPIEGVFGLTEVVHVFDGQTYRNHFEATSASVWLYEEQPPRTSLPGIQSGLVTNNRDPLNQGRVRVQFPWATEESRWYRVMAPYAGKQRGVFFTPEVGDEVVVAFEYGDPERGVVIGGIWNGIDIPPAEGPLVKSIVTPSGSTIRFDDRKDGSEVIEIHSPKGDALVQINQNGGKPVITLRSSGDISLEAEGQVRVQSESFVVKTTGNADIRASGNVVVNGGSNVTVKAGANGAVETGANLTLKAGGMANLVGGPVTNIVAAMVQIQPPGFMAPPNVVPPVNVPAKISSGRPTPSDGKGKLTQDTPTPRSKSKS